MLNWMFRTMYKLVKNTAIGGLGLGGALLALMVAFQEKIIYVPNAPGLDKDYPFDPTRLGLEFEDVWLTTRDNVKIHCWYLPFSEKNAGLGTASTGRGSRPTVLWLQENAGNMSYRLLFVKPLLRVCRCNVLMVMYRGYGSSEGSPSESGLRMDAEAALDYLGKREDVDEKNVAVFGRSLGGAVAIDLVSRHQDKVRALVIENTFTCIPDMAAEKFPFLKAVGIKREGALSFLIRHPWDSLGKIGKIKKPLLMLASTLDEMVPFTQMQELFKHQKSDDCVFFPMQAHHMTAYEEARNEYWPALKSFFDKHMDY
ncbi:alpha/beta-hydrolase [Chloropicon primus]|uniref:Alpha/beta-hydrolase n=1 Tax=Chloropicon primus TaxID=1764295 RepID=A0A5B8MLP4_9CHLO|nr:alpha/beta-hydrolase [Chloropicon primus]UPR00638.1 alpha/beta-hydrolase [Chloropicon primus]|eukprot:QDZ21426.1 alpha/beta-hydrolase [Chloropicon primus]